MKSKIFHNHLFSDLPSIWCPKCPAYLTQQAPSSRTDEHLCPLTPISFNRNRTALKKNKTTVLAALIKWAIPDFYQKPEGLETKGYPVATLAQSGTASPSASPASRFRRVCVVMGLGGSKCEHNAMLCVQTILFFLHQMYVFGCSSLTHMRTWGWFGCFRANGENGNEDKEVFHATSECPTK